MGLDARIPLSGSSPRNVLTTSINTMNAFGNKKEMGERNRLLKIQTDNAQLQNEKLSGDANFRSVMNTSLAMENIIGRDGEVTEDQWQNAENHLTGHIAAINERKGDPGSSLAMLDMVRNRDEQGMRNGFNKMRENAYELGFLQAPKDEGFTLGQGQTRYDSQGGVIAQGAPKERGLQEELIALQIEERKTQNQIREEKAGNERKAQEAAEMGRLGDAVTGVEGVDALLKDDLYKSLFGTYEFLDPTNRGRGAIDASAIRDQVVGLLTLENRQKLKGQGTITDQEAKTLERAATLLANRDISEGLAKQELEKVRDIFSRARERSVRLPKGVSWADIETTATANGMSQIEVLEELQRRTSDGG